MGPESPKWCSCYQKMGEAPVVCEPHLLIQEAEKGSLMKALCQGCAASDGRKVVILCAECVRKTSLEARRLERAKLGSGQELREALDTMTSFVEASLTQGGVIYDREYLKAELVKAKAALALPLAPEISPEEVAGIKQGLADITAGRVKPLEQIRAEMKAHCNAPNPDGSYLCNKEAGHSGDHVHSFIMDGENDFYWWPTTPQK